VTHVVLEHLAPGVGERIVDIGSGGGRLAIATAAEVGLSGQVVGVDLSERLVELARTRAAETQLSTVHFTVADAQTDSIDGGPFDAAVSQFGVMFFDEPIRAFTNIANHIKVGGRLVFVCWQPAHDNPWHIGAVLAPFVARSQEPSPGNRRTGPFTLGDPDHVTELLTASGWASVDRTPYWRTEVVDPGAIIDDGPSALVGIADHDTARARAALERHRARFAIGDGKLEIPLAFQIFTARRP
jgi:SAM-dependent methyltransferase